MTKSSLEIHALATQAAQKAEAEYIKQYGEPWFRGFAWVQFRGNSKFARDLSKAGITSNAYPTGKMVWNPGKSYTQSMAVKVAGSRAYADILCDHGVACDVYQRAD